MKRTSSKKYTPTESCRLMRGAGRAFYEYIFELRTEIKKVGCDGSHPLSWTDVDGHLMEAVHVNVQ